MFKVGALAGKFLPPQIGHLKLIDEAAKQCETLYVVLAENPEKTATLCISAGLKPINYKLRLKWLKQHFKNQKNIKFIYFDETGFPTFPDVEKWSERFKQLVGRKIDAKFIGEETYRKMNEDYFPESEVVIIRRGIDSPEISGTEIRENLEKNLDFAIPESRKYFEKELKNKG